MTLENLEPDGWVISVALAQVQELAEAQLIRRALQETRAIGLRQRPALVSRVAHSITNSSSTDSISQIIPSVCADVGNARARHSNWGHDCECAHVLFSVCMVVRTCFVFNIMVFFGRFF